MDYSTRDTDIVAYTWQANEYDPACTAEMLNWQTTGGSADAEAVIDGYAADRGIDRESRDSGVLPQPIFGSDDLYEEPADGETEARPRRCGRCHEPFVSN